MPNVQFRLGLDTVQSYKRLSYTPWHALAEFVDNSTQSYFNHEDQLKAAYEEEGEGLRVDVVYDRDASLIRVADNAMGMDRSELDHALEVGARPANTDGRSKFGMGLKTAACWLGNEWTIRTKKLGETTEYQVTVDVPAVAAGQQELPTRELDNQDPQAHYTILEIRRLNRPLRGRTLGKIRDFLSSMYRQDFRDRLLLLTWQGETVSWDFSDDAFLRSRDGAVYKKDFIFEIEDDDGASKVAEGWIGILDRGSRAKAGFSILHAGRVVKGWPDSWRPETIFGQYQGSNDLINQRIIGEIELDDFEVTQAKDDILWFGDDQDAVEEKLQEVSAEYVAVAKQRRRGDNVSTGPSDLEVQTAVEELEAELSSNELIDLITVEDVPPPEAVADSIRPLLEGVTAADPDFSAAVGRVSVKGYLAADMSPNDPYVVADSSAEATIVVAVNFKHPHINEHVGSQGVLNYLRHCVYDAIAEWQARQRAAAPDPDTIKLLKDRLLRVAMMIEMHQPTEGTPVV
jgi:hypothetical protein